MNDRRAARRSHRTRAGGVAVCLVVVALIATACGGNRSTAKPADDQRRWHDDARVDVVDPDRHVDVPDAATTRPA